MCLPLIYSGHLGQMDDLQFYALFNSISVMSGRWKGNTERLCAMEPRLRLKRFLPSAGTKPGSVSLASQRLTHQHVGDVLHE